MLKKTTKKTTNRVEKKEHGAVHNHAALEYSQKTEDGPLVKHGFIMFVYTLCSR